jgi:hypothetical protein
MAGQVGQVGQQHLAVGTMPCVPERRQQSPRPAPTPSTEQAWTICPPCPLADEPSYGRLSVTRMALCVSRRACHGGYRRSSPPKPETSGGN